VVSIKSKAQLVLLFNLLIRAPEGLNNTALLASSIRSLPGSGFRPRLSPLSLTQNFPNPDRRTSSPPSRVCRAVSSRVSTTRAAFFRLSTIFRTESMRCFFVTVIFKSSFVFFAISPGLIIFFSKFRI